MKNQLILVCIGFVLLIPYKSVGQSPEISLREFASGQIKKGVRSIGMGGDGATWGNYSLVYRDANTALMDGGVSTYSNNNTFGFTAVGVTTPALWRGLAIYAIALSQNANNISTTLKSPGLGSGAVPVHGNGSNEAVFMKIAMPIRNGFAVGLLLSYERSQFNSNADNNPTNFVRYQTNWLPSGGIGATWQGKRILVGVRALFNNDWEKRIDNSGISAGLNYAYEYRAGISVELWRGSLIDFGGNIRSRYNQIANSRQTDTEPNIGFEQNLWNRHFAFRAGLDESSRTGGVSIRIRPFVLDIAYVRNLGAARFGDLFGTNSNSVIATFVVNFGELGIKRS